MTKTEILQNSDIFTVDQWRRIIENIDPSDAHYHFIMLSAKFANPEQLEHLSTAFPNLVQAVKQNKEYQNTGNGENIAKY